jgi:chromosome segregation ATPase
MARVAGRDVILGLLDTMGQLRSSVERHEGDIGRLNTRMNAMAVRMDDMAVRMDDMAVRMDDMASRMAALAAETQVLRTSMVAMSEDMTAFAGDLKHLAQGYSETNGHLARLTKLLTEYAGSSDDRMGELEARVTKLEKKSA